MVAILENIMRSARFPQFVDELVELRSQEALSRARFRDTLDEDIHAEFINGEVVIQVSPATEDRDRGVKLEDCAANGVGEYWIADPDQRVIEQFTARGRTFEPAGTFSQGTISSRSITGFELPLDAAFDEAANHRFLQKLLG